MVIADVVIDDVVVAAVIADVVVDPVIRTMPLADLVNAARAARG
jgi:hypothetical protein